MDKKRAYIEFIDNFPLGIYRTTVEGRIRFCNRAFARIFGFDSHQELSGYQEVHLYRNKKDRGALLQKLLKKGWLTDESVSLKKKDGSPIECALTAKVHFDDDAIPIHLDVIVKKLENAPTKSRASETYENESQTTFDTKPIEALLMELAHNLTDQQKDMSEEKFQGVLEMAGGVAHHISQPLTVLNNTMNEIFADLSEKDRHLKKILIMRDQIALMNDIVRKIKNIKEYKAVDYVAGLKIVDIDNAS